VPDFEAFGLNGELSDDSELAPACRYVLASGGKQLRPRLLHAAAQLGPHPRAAAVNQAALAIELFHSASLAHDDVVDDSDLRRGRGTVGALFGNSAAGLAGGWLFGRAAALTADCGEKASELFSAASCRVCEGQMLEVRSLFDTARTPASYFEAVGGKTATLFELAGTLGAELADADEDTVGRVGSFAWSFGTAFQILDDIQDLLLDETVTGKPRGKDLLHGVYTLPVLYALEEDGSLAERLDDIWGPGDVAPAVAAICATDGPTQALADARAWVDRARAVLGGLDDRHDLLALLDDAVATPLGRVA
jgi:heptaprenyl diphosphate synthase